MASQHAHRAVASRYASALVDTALTADNLSSVEKDFAELISMLSASADLQAMTESPIIARTDQVNAVSALSEKAGFQKETKNFLMLLAHNRRLSLLESMILAFQEEMAKRRGEVTAHVQTAFALSPEQTRQIQETLASSLAQKVILNIDIDPSLIGGMIVTVGSQMIDDSVKRKLERLERAMKSNSNQNETLKKEAV
ncbi:MAG: F0F1 ATP synthase subunit delta [Alphaproteobacteria bacterium]|nr:F0F1 ATP synthase subunit delta [Alphaproteobacteria bacterium]